MRWFEGIKRRALGGRPVLKACNPRIGTSIIPLNRGDEDILFQYLSDKIHTLHFEGSVLQLTSMIHALEVQRGVTIQKMRLSDVKGKEKIMLLHLKTQDEQEIRRVIKLV